MTATRDHGEQALAGKRVLVAKAEVMRLCRHRGSRFGTYCRRGYIQQGVEDVVVKAR
jgi:hypothetical protein